MNKELMTYIETLSTKLGVAAEHLYAILVQQAKVDAITTLIVLFIMIPTLLYVTFFLKKKYDEADGYTDDGWAFAAIISGIITAIIIIIGVFEVIESIQQLLNPEYFAIKELLDTVKGDD